MGDPRTQPAWTDEAILAMGRGAFRQEADALAAIGQGLDAAFPAAVRLLLACTGQVLITGLGKSGIVARKMAATFTSTGTPSHFIHPVEAAHGDLGVVRGSDVVIGISRSGSNPEVAALLARCRQFGMKAIAITGGPESELAQAADLVLPVPIAREACPLDLTPTTSAVAAMAMGDALAVALITLRGFRSEDFAAYHPSGVLGRKLLVRVSELMHTGDELPVVSHRLSLRASLPEIVGKRLGGTCVVDDDGRLVGLCVDGDIKRILLERSDALDRPITEAMNPAPTTIPADMLALSALRNMEQRAAGPVTLLIVVDEAGRPAGLLHIHDVLRAGLL
ncbi:MAG TPA: KpsF/GutQ family sugar-phosphate isomerase [Candidatus Krumholzibacteria bacterium]|nr:KpsF/GutQ family sugar-phosphate isomerase [Candidatus Krumholzibacteria bacterium]